jgi:hypothetical protein
VRHAFQIARLSLNRLLDPPAALDDRALANMVILDEKTTPIDEQSDHKDRRQPRSQPTKPNNQDRIPKSAHEEPLLALDESAPKTNFPPQPKKRKAPVHEDAETESGSESELQEDGIFSAPLESESQDLDEYQEGGM